MVTTRRYRSFKKRPTRRYKRKVYKRKAKRRISRTLWPRSKVVKMRMVQSHAGIVGTTGACSMYTIKANSLNDPLATLGAGIPLGVDQLATMYQKYIVLGSKITVRFHPITLTGAGVVGIHLADNTTSLADHDYYKESQRTRTRIVSPDIDLATLTFNYSGKKFWKVQSLKDDSEQEATFSTTPGDPTDLAYYHVFIQDLTKAETMQVDAQITIEYIVLLTDPITPARSSL